MRIVSIKHILTYPNVMAEAGGQKGSRGKGDDGTAQRGDSSAVEAEQHSSITTTDTANQGRRNTRQAENTTTRDQRQLMLMKHWTRKGSKRSLQYKHKGMIMKKVVKDKGKETRN